MEQRDEGEHGTIMQNPPNQREFRIISIVAIVLVIIGLIFTMITRWIPGILIEVGIAIILMIIIWDKQYRTRPKTAQIRKDGILFTYRYGGENRLVLYSSIYWVMAPPGDSNKLSGNWTSDGMMASLDGKRYILHWPIAIAVKEAYKEVIGKYPPDLYDGPWGHLRGST